MTLTLSSPIAYRPTELSFDQLVAKAAQAAPGYDAAVLYRISLGDALSLSRIAGGERDGYTEEERKMIGKGMAIAPKPYETFRIEAASYQFEQLPVAFEEKDLPRLLLPYAGRERSVYVRIFHENMLETVMQFFLA